jgi:hypothetical protein
LPKASNHQEDKDQDQDKEDQDKEDQEHQLRIQDKVKELLDKNLLEVRDNNLLEVRDNNLLEVKEDKTQVQTVIKAKEHHKVEQVDKVEHHQDQTIPKVHQNNHLHKPNLPQLKTSSTEDTDDE